VPVVPVVPVVCGVGGSAVCDPARTMSQRDMLERLIQLVARRNIRNIYSKQPTRAGTCRDTTSRYDSLKTTPSLGSHPQEGYCELPEF